MATAEMNDTKEIVEAAEEASRPTRAAATTSSAQMFTFSRYVHVGPGAEQCEEGEAGSCEDPLHFHAWVRLPNKFQHKDIRDKGLAAKARLMRALRDPDSDEAVTFEAEIRELQALGDDSIMIDELIQRDWSEDYLTALRDVSEEEDFEHIDQDREEYQRIFEQEAEKPEDERSEEFKRLHEHLGRYRDAINAKLREIQEPKRMALRDRGHDGLVELIREQRMDGEGDRQFLHTYNEWTWLVCTYKPKRNAIANQPVERVFTGTAHLHEAAPEVIDALQEAFGELEGELQKGALGNS